MPLAFIRSDASFKFIEIATLHKHQRLQRRRQAHRFDTKTFPPASWYTHSWAANSHVGQGLPPRHLVLRLLHLVQLYDYQHLGHVNTGSNLRQR
jgi:hypothetical protein